MRHSIQFVSLPSLSLLTNLFLLSYLQITTEKLEELKGNIPRAGPRYRLGMYFETIHNLPCFDEVTQYEDTGYTSYWETDTEVDSEFGNFIFNNVSGDSASVICIDDTVDLNALRKRHEEIVAQSRSHPHYKLEQSSSSASSPTEHPLERSFESKHTIHSHRSRSASEGMCQSPPPVPPRRPSVTAIDPQDHTYETLDDCKEEYRTHQIYISKASDDSRGSQDSTAKPVSNDEAEFTHPSMSKQAEGASVKSPVCGKPRSSSLQSPKSPECPNYRQRRKLSEPSAQLLSTRKRRQERVSSKVPNHPPPIRGFPSGVSEDYAEYLATSVSTERRSPMCAPSSPAASPCQRGFTSSNSTESPKVKKTAPLVIKHKGKTYFVPVVDSKLQKELEKKSKAENPSVTIRQVGASRTSGNASNHHSVHTHRSFASAPKVDATDQAAPHRRRNSSLSKSSPHKVASKQVTHYGVF